MKEESSHWSISSVSFRIRGSLSDHFDFLWLNNNRVANVPATKIRNSSETNRRTKQPATNQINQASFHLLELFRPTSSERSQLPPSYTRKYFEYVLDCIVIQTTSPSLLTLQLAPQSKNRIKPLAARENRPTNLAEDRRPQKDRSSVCTALFSAAGAILSSSQTGCIDYPI